MTKEMLTAAIKDIPQEFDLDELFEKLLFVEEVEAARKEVSDGKTKTLDEVKEIVAGWRK